MKFNLLVIVAFSASQLLFSNEACATAAQSKAAKPSPAASAIGQAKKKRQPGVKPGDINSASKAELLKLPGVNTADAERIIAHRPYLSKAHLVTHNVISQSQYQGVKSMILARQKGLSTPMTTGEKWLGGVGQRQSNKR